MRHGGVELERLAAGCSFGVAEHYTDLFADLIDKDQAGARLRNRSGEFVERLRHEPCLQAHVRVAHFAVELGLGHQCGHRIDHQHIDSIRADKSFDDFERLLAVVRLRDEQVVGVHSQLLGVGRVEGVLGIHEGRQAAILLGFRDDLERDGGFAGGFRAEDLNDAAAGKAADAESGVEGDGAGGNDRDGANGFLGAQPHDRAFAKLLLEL